MIKKIIIIATLILLIILGSITYILFQNNYKEIENKSFEYWKNGDTRRGDLVIQNSIKENRKKEFVLTKYDFQKPVTTIVLLTDTLASGKENIQSEVFYLERTGINSFKVTSSATYYSTSYTFNETINLVKRYDFNKENPSKDKISIVSDLPPEKQQKIKQDQEDDKKLNPLEQKLQNTNDQQKYEICLSSVKDAEGFVEAIKEGKKTFTGEVFGELVVTDPKSDLQIWENQADSIAKTCEELKVKLSP